MARSFTRASNHYAIATSPPITGVPLTLAAWVNSTDTTNNQVVLCISDTESNGDGWYIQLRGDVAGDVINAGVGQSGGFYASQTTNGYSSGVWAHVAGTFASSTNRIAYLNGTAATANSTNATPVVVDSITVGRFTRLSSFSYLEGAVAEAAAWNVALTADEIRALSEGVNPFRIRSQNLKFYAPLYGVGSPEPNFGPAGVNFNLTVTGAVQAAHAPVQPAFGRVAGWRGLSPVAAISGHRSVIQAGLTEGYLLNGGLAR